MKREEIEKETAKLIDQKLEGFMWGCNDDGVVTALNLVFDKGNLVIIADGDTFKIHLTID